MPKGYDKLSTNDKLSLRMNIIDNDKSTDRMSKEQLQDIIRYQQAQLYIARSTIKKISTICETLKQLIADYKKEFNV